MSTQASDLVIGAALGDVPQTVLREIAAALIGYGVADMRQGL